MLRELAPGQEPQPLVALVAPQERRRLARLGTGQAQPAAGIRGAGAEEPLQAAPRPGDGFDGGGGDAHPRDVHRLQGRRAGQGQLPGLPGRVRGAEHPQAPVRPRQGGRPEGGVVAVLAVDRGPAHLVHRLVGAVRGVASAHVLGDGDVARPGDPLQGALLVRRPRQEHGEGLPVPPGHRRDHVRPQHRPVAHRRRDVQLDAHLVRRARPARRRPRHGPGALIGAGRVREAHRPAEIDGPLRRSVPALGGVVCGVQVALHPHLRAPLGEGEQPAHGDVGAPVVAAQGGAVDEGDAPPALHVRAPAGAVVRVGVGVPAEPERDGPGVRRQVALESLRVRAAVHVVEVGGPLRAAVREVAVVVALPSALLVLAVPLPGAGGHRRLLEQVVVGGEDDAARVGLHRGAPPGERLPGDRPGGVPAAGPPADGRAAVVAVAHHQEEQVTHRGRRSAPRCRPPGRASGRGRRRTWRGARRWGRSTS